MEDGVTFDIIDYVDRWSGRYPESLMNIRIDLAEKNLFPVGVGWGGGGGGGGVGVGFSVSLRNG